MTDNFLFSFFFHRHISISNILTVQIAYEFAIYIHMVILALLLHENNMQL